MISKFLIIGLSILKEPIWKDKQQIGEAMQTLRLGSKGILVQRLQNKLIELGYEPGSPDGIFGQKTDNAVKAFQTESGLISDGIVGRRTLALLALELSEDIPIDTEVQNEDAIINSQMVCRICHDSPANNIKRHWPLIYQAMVDNELADNPMLLMAIATVYVETGRFTPIDEYLSKYNTTAAGHPFDKYDDRSDLGNRGYPDGARYKGRGFIQLTGRANYRNIGQLIGVGEQLENYPESANDPDIAAKILAAFLKRQESSIRSALEAGDLKKARRLVNGGSHGLPEFSRCYRLGESLVS